MGADSQAAEGQQERGSLNTIELHDIARAIDCDAVVIFFFSITKQGPSYAVVKGDFENLDLTIFLFPRWRGGIDFGARTAMAVHWLQDSAVISGHREVTW